MNIIELAKQAGFLDADEKGVWITDGYWDKELKAFAALVAAHEREECATIADEWDKVNKLSNYGAFIAQQIRARSNT